MKLFLDEEINDQPVKFEPYPGPLCWKERLILWSALVVNAICIYGIIKLLLFFIRN